MELNTTNYSDVVVGFLKDNFLEYTIDITSPNLIGTKIACKPANSSLDCNIIVHERGLLWIVALPPVPINEERRSVLNAQIHEINKKCRILSFKVVDNGIIGVLNLESFDGGDVYQIIRDSYFSAKDDLERSWLPIMQAVFTGGNDSSTLAQFKRIIESEKETINLTVEEDISFSGRRLMGRLLGFSYALVDSRKERASDALKLLDSFKNLPSITRKYAKDHEQEVIENLHSKAEERLSSTRGCQADTLLGQLEGIYVFVNQLSGMLLCSDNDIPLGEKVTIERKVKEQDDSLPVNRKELTSDDLRAAFLNWKKSTKDVKRLLMKEGKDETQAQLMVDEICRDINEERKSKMMPYLVAAIVLTVLGVWLFLLNHPTALIIVLFLWFASVFCLHKSYKYYRHYRIIYS